MTVHATARDATAHEPAAVVLTLPDGATVALETAQGRALHHELLNAVLHLERAEREGALAAKVKTARRHERELRRPAKVDDALREREG